VAVAALVAALLACAGTARAAQVVLAHPPGADAFLEELFNRVTGELRVHAFAPLIEEGPEGEPSMPQAAALLERTGADAAIFLSQQGEASVVRIWIRRRDALPALQEATALHRSDEVPTMLATRAVDLLRSELARAAPAPPPVVVSTTPPPAPEAPSPWSLQVGASALADPGGFGAAAGPEAALARRGAGRWSFAARVSGPFWGASASGPEATATLLQGLATLEAWPTLLQGRVLAVHGVLGAGAHFARADGEVIPGVLSLRAEHHARVSFAATAGVEAEVILGARLALVATARAAAPLPSLSIVVGRDTHHLGPVLPAGALALRVGF
jgi:hypothetical protein